MSTTTATETAAAGADRAQSPWRVVGASLVGTTLEWYDFFLYGTAAAVVFPKVFFVKADPLTGTPLIIPVPTAADVPAPAVTP